MLIAIFFHFWMVLATTLIVGGNASTPLAVCCMFIISFFILSLISYHLYISIYSNSNFNNFKGRKKNDYISKRTNNHIKAVFLDGTPLEIKTVEPFDFCIKKVY